MRKIRALDETKTKTDPWLTLPSVRPVFWYVFAFNSRLVSLSLSLSYWNICSIMTLCRPLAWVGCTLIITFSSKNVFPSAPLSFSFLLLFIFQFRFASSPTISHEHTHTHQNKCLSCEGCFSSFSFAFHFIPCHEDEEKNYFSLRLSMWVRGCLEPLFAAIKRISRAIAPPPNASRTRNYTLNWRKSTREFGSRTEKFVSSKLHFYSARGNAAAFRNSTLERLAVEWSIKVCDERGKNLLGDRKCVSPSRAMRTEKTFCVCIHRDDGW